jgi:hypothetical protein
LITAASASIRRQVPHDPAAAMIEAEAEGRKVAPESFLGRLS